MNIGIIFTHHKNDDATLNNFNRLKQFNPDKTIYPVGFKGSNLLPNSFVVDDAQDYLPKNTGRPDDPKFIYWTQADLLIYDFIYHNELIHDKYIIFEWDTYCNCSIEEFYGEALNKDNFGHDIHDPVPERWTWYEQLSGEQRLKFEAFGGYTPMSGLLFSKEILLKIKEHILQNPRRYDNVFSELRLGSLVKTIGAWLKTPFPNSEKYMNWQSDLIIFDKNKNGYYHPVKSII
jgi:hypothetical protein